MISSNKAAPVAALVLLLASAVSHAQQDSHVGHHPPAGESTMLRTPSSIAAEHRGLHQSLRRASQEPGELGAAARALEEALAPHFRREGEIATPPLGLLPSLASGTPTAEMRAVLPMTDALERELPQMMREHDAIRKLVGRFRGAAESARRAEYVRFSEELADHAREEEEILYPAAVLVGRFVARTAPEQ